jgi:glycosyltransferase involved in cell wall biosynthesis
VVGSQELVADGDSGLLVPYGDSAALAEALAKLVADAGLRQRMGQAGEARVKAQYTIARYVAGTEAILAEAARKP